MMLPVTALLVIPAATMALQSWEINEKLSSSVQYGDMILTPLQRQRYGSSEIPVRGVSKKGSPFNRWKNNTVPYTLSLQYSNEQKQIIRESFATLEKVACFRFTERTNEPDFLAIVPLDGCYSYVGKVGGRQVLSLAPDCLADYIVWHEVMHAIGFEHEHQRPDRDDFIRVEYSNVEAGQLANFEKLSSREVDYKEQYDYKSIMHYDSLAFGRKDRRTKHRLVTMIPLRKGVILEDNMKLSLTDVRRLNDLGRCQGEGNISLGERKRIVCEDKAKNCARMEESGVCSSALYHKAMLKNCAKTCRFCKGESVGAHEVDLESTSFPEKMIEAKTASVKCEDTDSRCSAYAQNGFCTNKFYEGIKTIKCAKTCNLCSGIDT